MKPDEASAIEEIRGLSANARNYLLDRIINSMTFLYFFCQVALSGDGQYVEHLADTARKIKEVEQTLREACGSPRHERCGGRDECRKGNSCGA